MVERAKLRRNLTKWLGRKDTSSDTHEGGWDGKEQDAPMHSLPLLPAKRPRNITPSSSRDCLVLSGSSRSSFFQRLPAEIRRLILIRAFGNHTLHMDLIYDYPIAPLSERSQDPGLEGRHARIPWVTRRPIPVSGWEPRSWRWQGSVCHHSAFGVDGNSGPWNDKCRGGWTYEICNPKSERHTPCFLGIMGWLLTCKQA